MNAKGRADVDKLVSEWLEAVETGDYARKGWSVRQQHACIDKARICQETKN